MKKVNEITVMKLVLKKTALALILVYGTVSYSQSNRTPMPGSESYGPECAVVYSNAYKDGFACASGNRALCGYYPTSNTACETANVAGYNEGYAAANTYKETNNFTLATMTKTVSQMWNDFLKSLKP